MPKENPGSAVSPGQPEADLQKTQLEIENLKLDIDSKRKLQRFSVTLQLLPSFTVIVAVLGFVFSVWQYRSQQRQHETETMVQLQQHQKETNDAAQREFMKPLLEKQLTLYVEASGAAATIASTADEGERRKAKNEFWKLYWGPLVMVETEEVSGAMKSFGYCLDGTESCNDADLKNRSLALASTLERSMLKNWNAKPEQFTNQQFDYRRPFQ